VGWLDGRFQSLAFAPVAKAREIVVELRRCHCSSDDGKLGIVDCWSARVWRKCGSGRDPPMATVQIV
jgi:hypothetical protein